MPSRLAEAAPEPPAKENRLRFPITDSRVPHYGFRLNFDAEVAAGRLGTISNPVQAAIEAAQPYNRLHDKLPPLLGILRDLNNADKHKLIRLVYATVHQARIGFVGTDVESGNWKAVPFAEEIKNGSELFAMVSDTPSPGREFDKTEFTVVVALKHGKRDAEGPDWTDRTEVAAVYQEIATEVRRTIYTVSGKVPNL
jgi:hypothetical protein